MEASSLIELINWETEVLHEPIFTCNLSQMEVSSFKEVPFNPPYFPNHTQSVERAVKLVTEASKSVTGYKNRDGYIRTQIANRTLVPNFKSKQDIMAIF